jgi:methylmalonyl-CoA mutase
MSDFYSDFPQVNKDQWIQKVKQDLKSRTIEEALQFAHPIEEINYKAYGFKDNGIQQKNNQNSPDYLRGTHTEHNDWFNNVVIPKQSAKQVNKMALNYLMTGANALTIDLGDFDETACNEAIKGIKFKYITSSFVYHTKVQFSWLKELFENNGHAVSLSTELPETSVIEGIRSITVKGTDVQYSGGNVAQELAWCLHRGHQELYRLIEHGLSVEDAANQIKFQLGVGGNYFFEIAKIRSLRSLWYDVVQAYAKDKQLGKAYIEAKTGFLNKSLRDPHTNLLRQTTEALSAVVGGIDELTILPYNFYAETPDLKSTQRLAMNIGLLMKEESYMDKVIDPSGGSYNIEELTENISDKAWSLFQQLENGQQTKFETAIQAIAAKRIQRVSDEEDLHIGVNKYFNPEKSTEEWGKLPTTPFGDMVILEQHVNIEA